MVQIGMQEGEQVEFKRLWNDHALEDIAAFANTRGGVLFVGVGDDGEVIGVDDPEAELQRIANVIASRLGLNPSLARRTFGQREVIEVRVEPAPRVVAHNGRYRCRVGSTNRDLTPEELHRLLLERSGQSWDSLPTSWGLERVSESAIATFTALAKHRFPEADAKQPERILQNLALLREGKLNHAAVLLFAERPQELFPHARLRIGVFKGTQIVDDHEFTGTLWEQLDSAMERFRRVLKVSLDSRVTAPTLEGLQHREVWEYPLEALREAVINALIHRDYTMPGNVEIRLSDEKLTIWNPGNLPTGIRVEDLKKPEHPSVRRNPLLADAFFYAGLIERWGTGTTRIVRLCRERGLLDPEFVAEPYSFQVLFLKDPYTPERLRAIGLNERQVRAVLYVKEHGTISNRDYQTLTGASKPTATRDLNELVVSGVFRREGEHGRGTRYLLKGSETAQ